jgi:hypothetical protein
MCKNRFLGTEKWYNKLYHPLRAFDGMVLEFWGVRIVAVSPSRSSCTTLYKVVLSVALWDVPSHYPQMQPWWYGISEE